MLNRLHLALAVIGALVCFYYVPKLPEEIAVHFGPTGEPDAFGPPTMLWVIYGIWISVAALIWYIGEHPGMITTLPKGRGRSHERKYQQILAGTMPLLNLLTGAFMLNVLGIMIYAAIHDSQMPELYFWITLIIYLSVTIFISMRAHLRALKSTKEVNVEAGNLR